MHREWIFDQLDNHIRRDIISPLENRSKTNRAKRYRYLDFVCSSVNSTSHVDERKYETIIIIVFAESCLKTARNVAQEGFASKK